MTSMAAGQTVSVRDSTETYVDPVKVATQPLSAGLCNRWVKGLTYQKEQ